MIKFVVIECRRSTENRHYARIHRTGCGHAREPNHKTASTLCHGYFDTYYEALDFAKSLNLETVYECELCSPRHALEGARAGEKAESKMTMNEFLFYKVGGRRNRTEVLHDLLVVAKDGLKKTRIASEATLNWYQMVELLTFAEAEGLVKEVEVPPYELYGSIRSPAVVWKTTEKGLKYAKNVYDNRAREETEG